MPDLVLASTSPRRKELLEKLHIPFTAFSPNVDESTEDGLEPSEVVMGLAERKARAALVHHPDSCVIGSDTIVAYGGLILGKPSGRTEAKEMLSALSGKTHQVFTGAAVIYNGQTHRFYEKTNVTFWELKDDEIERYLHTGEPYDKAGAYGIQGLGALLVKSIHGDYYSVVGLPISRLSRLLSNLGFSVPPPEA